jgi:hypothetical protein
MISKSVLLKRMSLAAALLSVAASAALADGSGPSLHDCQNEPARQGGRTFARGDLSLNASAEGGIALKDMSGGRNLGFSIDDVTEDQESPSSTNGLQAWRITASNDTGSNASVAFETNPHLPGAIHAGFSFTDEKGTFWSFQFECNNSEE